MNMVRNNPYRTIGLLVGATAREQERQVKRLKQYIEAEKGLQDDFSFPALGKLHRTVESVSEAASKLSLDSDKMSSALFWFYKGNAISDEPAFDSLKEANQQNAIEIWKKLVSKSEVTKRNCSAFQNLSTLLLSNSFNDSQVNIKFLGVAISLKLKFLESDFVEDFQAFATDETYRATKKEIQLLFLTQLQKEIDKVEGITYNQLLEIINKQEFSAKGEFLNGFVQKPIEQIEKKIDETKVKRKSNKADAGKAGRILFAQTSESIAQLKSILGTSDLKFSSISDKVASEILQCGIVYFSHLKDTDTDPSDVVNDLFQKAKSLSVGNIAKERCKENTAGLQEWIDNKPERDKQELINEELLFITSKLNRFQETEGTIYNAKELMASCKPKLENIKNTLGSTDDLYLKISGTVVANAQDMIIFTVNESMNKRTNYVKYISQQNSLIQRLDFDADAFLSLATKARRAPEYSLGELQNVIESAWKATVSLGLFDMPNEQREFYNKNKASLKDLYKKAKGTIVFFWGDTPIERITFFVVGIVLLVIILGLIGSK